MLAARLCISLVVFACIYQISLAACGDSLLDSGETCDDGNASAGDGCSASCKTETGWSCYTQKFTAKASVCKQKNCPDGTAPDCNNTCSGWAILDYCGECVYGNTKRLANYTMDDCGVCGGTNADKDSCGLCHGTNTRDVCGVCFGDGKSCLDCKGVINGTKVYDACGNCVDKSVASYGCPGCNGKNYSRTGEGKYYDRCGVCGGTHKVHGQGCPIGCDGKYGSGLTFDCWGVCGGTATVDSCGVCTGGTTGRTADWHKCSGQVCFSPLCQRGQSTPGSCSGTTDVCGVCSDLGNVAGSTCKSNCDASLPPGTINNVNICGQCGVANPGSGVCTYGCNASMGELNGKSAGVTGASGTPLSYWWILGSTDEYDCQGTCKGYAKNDTCGGCWGGTAKIGGNAVRTDPYWLSDCNPVNDTNLDFCFFGPDNCGNCNPPGYPQPQRTCGFCDASGANYLDDCLVCLGYNYGKTECGCKENGTIPANCVIGCDGKRFDETKSPKLDKCGVCGGSTTDRALCPGVVDIRVQDQTQKLLIYVGSSLGGLMIILGIVGYFIYQRRKKNFVKRYEEKRLRELKDAPQGEVSLVFTDIQGSTILWETFPDEMPKAIQDHHRLCREILTKYKGYEVKTEGDAFMIAFHTPAQAIQFTMGAQIAMFKQKWPARISKYATSVPEKDANGRVIFCGLRVRMGIHTGTPRCKQDPKTQIMDYYGSMVNRASRVQSVAYGAQVLISQKTLDGAKAFLDDPKNAVDVQLIGDRHFKGIKGKMTVYQILPKQFSTRSFPPIEDYIEPKKEKSSGSSSSGSSSSSEESSEDAPVQKPKVRKASVIKMDNRQASAPVAPLGTVPQTVSAASFDPTPATSDGGKPARQQMARRSNKVAPA